MRCWVTVFWVALQCGGPRRGARHDAGNQRGKRTSTLWRSGRPAPPRRSRTLRPADSARIRVGHAASLAEATPEV